MSMMSGCASKLVNVLKGNASHMCYARQQLFFHDPSSALLLQNAAQVQGIAIRKFASLVARFMRHPAGDQVASRQIGLKAAGTGDWRALMGEAQAATCSARRPLPPTNHRAKQWLIASQIAATSNLRQQAGQMRKIMTAVSAEALPAAVKTVAATTSATTSFPSLVAGGPMAERAVGWWLFGCSAWVFSMVVLGGVTRLTRSGLSMTEWRFSGTLPPLTPQEWEVAFDKYKASPEYNRVNKGMKMEDFKFIFWMEYAHRMWGRALGVVFLAPCAYFAARGYFTRSLAARLGLLGSLGAGQGFVGWWMVQSGLEEPKSEYEIPRVSPYRLAAHLTSAFIIYSGLVWTALTVAMPSVRTPESAVMAAARTSGRRIVVPLALLIGCTALSGAFVAGNDAGHAYNTFPTMNGQWVPDGLLLLDPWWRNLFENTATVQFDHRVLATSTLLCATSVWVASRSLPLPPPAKLLLNALLGMTALQVTLGVSTLLAYVPVSLGSAHQAGALTLFTIVLTLAHNLRRQPRGALAVVAHSSKKFGVSLA